MSTITKDAEGPQPDGRWSRIPAELRERPQWCVAGPDKIPRAIVGGKLLYASSTSPSYWMTFEQACSAACERGADIGYVLNEADPFTCIDLDVKDASTDPDQPQKWTTPEQRERHASIIARADSYTERSRSGLGWHVWVRGKVGRGRRRDGVEVYSQERFIICTGYVEHDRPVSDRREFVSNLASQMRPLADADAETRPDEPGDDMGCCIAAIAMDTPGELGRLMRGEWEGRHYPSHSEADFALMTMLARLTQSDRACREAFRFSSLSKRDDKPDKYTDRHLNLTLRNARAQLEADAIQIEEGRRIAEALDWTFTAPVAVDDAGLSLLERLSVDWTSDADAEVPDIVEGLVADEDVTLLGGHGGIGKGFLSLQMACAVAAGGSVLNRDTRQHRVLYYSAEDGRKRLTRRLQRLAEQAGLDEGVLRQNLRVLDASEVEPLYGETIDQGTGKRPVFTRLLGPRADFDNLQKMVAAFDPQLVVIDGASDTFDGNEIARREVRAFIKMLRRVHPARPVGVLVTVHIDRSSARGNSTNDDGYAGSSQWHNSCRRRLFLQQEVRREKDEITEEWGMVLGDIKLRVMKNQDGPPDPNMVLERGMHGLWQVGVECTGTLAFKDETDHGPALLRLVRDYYERGTYMSTSLAPQAHTGVYPTLRSDPGFPKELTRKRTAELVRQLERDGMLVVEPYQRTNRSRADRWAVVGALAAVN